jgi:membrane protein implicated in regulation of membrane protease activity
MSFLNGFTLTVFVAWFGAAGYLLTRHTGVLPMLGLMMSVGAGTVGALIVFGFLVKVLLPHDKAIDQADYEMVGVLGRVNTSIRAGGTGELIFTLAGTRRSCGARTEDGLALPKGAEVIVTRFEKGIAYVKTWDELAGELHSSGQSGANV